MNNELKNYAMQLSKKIQVVLKIFIDNEDDLRQDIE